MLVELASDSLFGNLGLIHGKKLGYFTSFLEQVFRSGTEISIYGTFSTPHNSYVEMLIDFGVFGLILVYSTVR
jgi:hypothetical protein